MTFDCVNSEHLINDLEYYRKHNSRRTCFRTNHGRDLVTGGGQAAESLGILESGCLQVQ